MRSFEAAAVMLFLAESIANASGPYSIAAISARLI
jgi:hypothetical protein